MADKKPTGLAGNIARLKAAKESAERASDSTAVQNIAGTLDAFEEINARLKALEAWRAAKPEPSKPGKTK